MRASVFPILGHNTDRNGLQVATILLKQVVIFTSLGSLKGRLRLPLVPSIRQRG